VLFSKKNGEKFIIRGSGKPLRQFIFSIDLAKLIMIVLGNQNNINNIILSDSEENEVTIEYIGRIIAKKYNYEHMIEFDSSFSDGQYKKTVSNEIIKNILNDNFEFTNIEKGINYTIDCFLNT
jgi:GDP-L-fucose synthase